MPRMNKSLFFHWIKIKVCKGIGIGKWRKDRKMMGLK
jgi:hypothetical protein